MTTKKKNKKSKSPGKKVTTSKESATLLDKAMFAELMEHVRVTNKETARDRRQEVLARVAGSIAAEGLGDVTRLVTSPEGLATVAITIAEEILKKAGINIEPAALADTSVETNIVPTDEEHYVKIRDFLINEWSRREHRQLVGVELLYAAGQGYRNETIRNWERMDEPELFATEVNVDNLVSTIIRLAANEADAKEPGKHRFIVRTRQHIGARPTMSFALYRTQA